MNRHWSRISGAVAGVVFALFLFFSLATVDPLLKASDQELLAWWSDDGNLQASFVSMYLMLLAVPFFLQFLVQLRSRLRSAEGPEGWSELVFSSGLVFAALLGVAAFSRGVIAQSVSLSDEPLPGADVLRYATEFSNAAYSLVAMPAAAIMVGVAAVIILRTKAFAAWLGWLGLLVAAGSLVAVFLLLGAIASPLLVIWVLAACFNLLRGSVSQVAGLADVPKRPIGRAKAVAGDAEAGP